MLGHPKGRPLDRTTPHSSIHSAGSDNKRDNLRYNAAKDRSPMFCMFTIKPEAPRSPSAIVLECVWNVMAHAQKPDFVFHRNGRVHLNRRGASVQSTTGRRGVRISGSNVGYTMFRGCVKSTGYPLHSAVSPSLPLPCVTVCHHISTGLYMQISSSGGLYTMNCRILRS